MINLEQMLDFTRGTMRKPSRARVRIGDQALIAEVLAQGPNVEVVGAYLKPTTQRL